MLQFTSSFNTRDVTVLSIVFSVICYDLICYNDFHREVLCLIFFLRERNFSYQYSQFLWRSFHNGVNSYWQYKSVFYGEVTTTVVTWAYVNMGSNFGCFSTYCFFVALFYNRLQSFVIPGRFFFRQTTALFLQLLATI